MQEDLSISLIQLHQTWHNPQANFDTAKAEIAKIKEADVVVLPEMWSSGFTMYAYKYYHHTEDALSLMKRWSIDIDACIIGSLITKVGEEYYNRLYAVISGNVYATYDKKHLFKHSGEDRFFKPGDKKSIIDYKGWKISLNICYDLRFPVWCRNIEDYDIQLFSANWPDKRIGAWNTLLQARAIENQCYVVGANCYGNDVWGNSYAGYSTIIDYCGTEINSLHSKGGIVNATISKESLQSFRKSLPFLRDRDCFTMN
jgi:omega-amidase